MIGRQFGNSKWQRLCHFTSEVGVKPTDHNNHLPEFGQTNQTSEDDNMAANESPDETTTRGRTTRKNKQKRPLIPLPRLPNICSAVNAPLIMTSLLTPWLVTTPSCPLPLHVCKNYISGPTGLVISLSNVSRKWLQLVSCRPALLTAVNLSVPPVVLAKPHASHGATSNLLGP